MKDDDNNEPEPKPDEADKIHDLQAAMDFVDEGLRRLETQLACIKGHWEALMGEEDVLNAVESAAHVYAMIHHVTAMPDHFYRLGQVLWDHVAPEEVKEQLMVETVERATGMPQKVTGRLADGVLLISPDEIVVPDDVSELDGEDE